VHECCDEMISDATNCWGCQRRRNYQSTSCTYDLFSKIVNQIGSIRILSQCMQHNTKLNWLFCRIAVWRLVALMWKQWTIHTITTSFVITLYRHCCRRRVVDQRVVSEINVVCGGWNICSLCSVSINTNLW